MSSSRASPRLKAKRDSITSEHGSGSESSEHLTSTQSTSTKGTPILKSLLIFLCAQAIIHGITQVLAYYSSKSGHQTLQNLLLLSFSIQMFVFVHASGLFGNERTERFYDLTGSCTYISNIIYSIHRHGGWHSLSHRQKFVTLSVVIWSIRLGSFLFSRINREGGVDSRFTEIKKSLFRFCNAWILQGAWCWITALPVYVMNTVKNDTNAMVGLDFVGLMLWLVGFCFEVTADSQKNAFREDSANKGKFIKSGLWSISRHPNYFGEITLWFGIFLTVLSGVIGQPLFDNFITFAKSSQLYCLLFSPVFVYLLLNYVSGVNLLEKSADEKWGRNADYQKYKKTTPVLFPKLF